MTSLFPDRVSLDVISNVRNDILTNYQMESYVPNTNLDTTAPVIPVATQTTHQAVGRVKC